MKQPQFSELLMKWCEAICGPSSGDPNAAAGAAGAGGTGRSDDLQKQFDRLARTCDRLGADLDDARKQVGSVKAENEVLKTKVKQLQEDKIKPVFNTPRKSKARQGMLWPGFV